MKSGKLLAFLLMVFLSVDSLGQTKDGVIKGIKYSITPSNSGKKVNLTDVVTFNFTAKTAKDSVLQSSLQTGHPVKIQIVPSRDIVDLMDIFVLLSENDAVIAMIPTDSIFKNNEQNRPPFLPKGSALNYSIKIEKVQTLDEAIAERDKANEVFKLAEKDSITKYITKNKLTVTTTPSGLRYLITQPSAKPKPVVGDTLLINYIGRTIDGKLFDSSIEAEAKKAGLIQPGRPYEPITVVVGAGEVIKGWDEGFLLLNEGSKATFIIPSDLGYGPQGRGDAIKPYSPLVFDVELVKVKRAKK
jgi:FKBP-type peptidyl-prolyl cis-trans isomerase FkpA